MQRGDNTRLIVADRSLRRDRLVALVLVVGLLAATMAAWAIARDRENHDAEKDRRVAAAALVGSLSADYAQTEAVLASASALVPIDPVDPRMAIRRLLALVIRRTPIAGRGKRLALRRAARRCDRGRRRDRE